MSDESVAAAFEGGLVNPRCGQAAGTGLSRHIRVAVNVQCNTGAAVRAAATQVGNELGGAADVKLADKSIHPATIGRLRGPYSVQVGRSGGTGHEGVLVGIHRNGQAGIVAAAAEVGGPDQGSS